MHVVYLLIVILKFTTLTILKTMVKFNSNLNLKIFHLPNNIFEPISNFQMKLLFPNMALSKSRILNVNYLANMLRICYEHLARNSFYSLWLFNNTIFSLQKTKK